MPNNNSYNTAQNLGTLNGAIAPITNFVGTNDREDYFRFTLAQNSTVAFNLTGLSQSAQLEFAADLNGNGVFSTDEAIEADGVNRFSNTAIDRGITRTLPTGTYWARVSTNNTERNTNYTLSATATPVATLTPDPGGTFPTARNLGVLSAPQTFSDAVGSVDRRDLYQFTVNQNSEVTLNLTGLSESAQVYLVADLNGNGAYENNERVEADGINPFGSSTVDRGIVKILTPGTYWAEISTNGTDENTGYTFTASATPRPTLPADPGGDYNTALNIGSLSAPQTFTDAVGSLDRRDFYRFSLTETGTVTLNLSGLTEAAQLYLVSDLNGNGSFSSNEIIEDDGVNQFINSTQDRGIVEPLAAGTYFILVEANDDDDNTGYTLTASSTARPGGGGDDNVSNRGFFNFQQWVRYQQLDAGITIPFTPVEIGQISLPFLFDETYYLSRHSDIAAAVANGALTSGYQHFVNFGLFEGRDPSVLYSEDFYLSQNADVAAAVSNGFLRSGLEHYVLFGHVENRVASSLFDPTDYLVNNPDVAAVVNAGALRSGFEHYVEFGFNENRLPNLSLYSEGYYLQTNPDVANAVAAGALATGFDHYILSGQREGRSPSALFQESSYLTANLDVAAAVGFGAFSSGFEHYIAFGRAEGRSPV